jgi:hypothetical protein
MAKPIPIDPALFEFARYISEESDPNREWTKTELIEHALHVFANHDRQKLHPLRAALEKLLSGPHSDPDLDDLWGRTNARIRWAGGRATRDLLTETLVATDARIARAGNWRYPLTR